MSADESKMRKAEFEDIYKSVMAKDVNTALDTFKKVLFRVNFIAPNDKQKQQEFPFNLGEFYGICRQIETGKRDEAMKLFQDAITNAGGGAGTGSESRGGAPGRSGGGGGGGSRDGADGGSGVGGKGGAGGGRDGENGGSGVGGKGGDGGGRNGGKGGNGGGRKV